MKKIAIVGIILSVILLIWGLVIEVPSSYLSFYGIKEYVGGDAYNYIIEAGLRGGRIAGAMVQKVVLIISGCILFWMSLFAIALNNKLSIVHKDSIARKTTGFSETKNDDLVGTNSSEQYSRDFQNPQR